MIHVIETYLAPGHRPLLRSMFADRKRLFVDLFGRGLPMSNGQYGFDQRDNADLIAADENGGHAALIRPFPCARPHTLRPRRELRKALSRSECSCAASHQRQAECVHQPS
ncbi:hypothetical protein GCM10009087_30070 [Sphingomonas oligophenolica]|uniref:Uncharacterized protein n=1 Tax=Sphingomonas oligophenolica TaxID=301154 RepID=A0ABU9Y6F9_9SPHN